MNEDQIKKSAFDNIFKSFQYDDILHEIALGNKQPKRGQLEAIKMVQTRGDNLMKLWQAALGIELPEQTIRSYVITCPPLPSTPDAVTSNSGQPPVQGS
jgi:hypothetical protein